MLVMETDLLDAEGVLANEALRRVRPGRTLQGILHRSDTGRLACVGAPFPSPLDLKKLGEGKWKNFH
jgi:hypothetical protein